MKNDFDQYFGWIDDDFAFRFSYCLRRGVEDYFEGMRNWPQAGIAATSRSRTSLTVDLIGQRANEAWADLPKEVRIEREYDITQLFIPRHNILVKFNQCDEQYRVHPPNTERACNLLVSPLLFPPEEIQLPSGCLTLFAVYGLNRAKNALQRAAITLQGVEEVVWKKELPEPPADHKCAIIRPLSPQTGPAIIDIDEERRVGNE